MASSVTRIEVSAGRRTRRRFGPFEILCGIVILIVAVLIVYPLLRMVIVALVPDGALGLDLIVETLGDPRLHEAALNTAILVVATVAISIPLAVTMAWLNERTDARLGSVSSLLPVLPMLVPSTAMAIGWLFLGDARVGFISSHLNAALNAIGIEGRPVDVASWGGLIFAYTLLSVAIAYVVIAGAFQNVDPSLEEAARISGKRPLRVLVSVSAPAIRHAIGSATLLVTILVIGVYAIPIIIGTPARINVLSVYIYRLIHAEYPAQTGKAVVVGLALILVIGLIWLVQQRLNRAERQAQISGRGMKPHRIHLSRSGKLLGRGFILVYVVITTVLPMAALTLVSFQPFWSPTISVESLTTNNYVRFFVRPDTIASLQNSLVLAVVSASITVIAAMLIVTYAKEAGRGASTALGYLTKAPAAIPATVLAVGMLVALGPAPFFLIGTVWILLAGFVTNFMPQATIAAETAVNQAGKDLVEAARVSGASRGRTFRAVLFPLSRPGLAAGWVLIFAVVIGDINIAAILAGPGNTVIGYQILYVFESGSYGDLAALATVVTVLTAVVVGAALLLTRQRFGARERRGRRRD